MKELEENLSEAQTNLAQLRAAVSQLKARRLMASSFNPADDFMQALRATRDAACQTADDYREICRELNDIILELEPPG